MFFDEITNQISLVDEINIQIINIIDTIISKFQDIKDAFNSIKQCIKKYSDAPNLASLNTVVVLLNYYSPLNIEKLRGG